MRISRVELKNWMNFKDASVDVAERAFLVGPNACGKSNFLDALRFLRDIANRRGGGLQKACEDRGGVSKIRCLAARRYPEISIAVELSENGERLWRYEVAFTEAKTRNGGARLTREVVSEGQKEILGRPNDEDEKDPPLLSQTYLEQINLNKKFREIAEFFETINYLHLVPQIIRNPDSLSDKSGKLDANGRNFLERIAETPEKTRIRRLKKMEEGLKIAVPQMKELKLERDGRGVPHLAAVYQHWRPKAGKQTEERFSDGTLRLLGLLWALQEDEGPLLLEEPELSLNGAIIQRIPGLIHRTQRARRRRQVFITTHSADLLSDPGIGDNEILMLRPSDEGTKVVSAASREDIRALLAAGLAAGEVILSETAPENVAQLGLFE
jgi:predicted ATPase